MSFLSLLELVGATVLFVALVAVVVVVIVEQPWVLPLKLPLVLLWVTLSITAGLWGLMNL